MDHLALALQQTRKLLHVGANTGQEAARYHELSIQAWHVEAVPDLYEQLSDNLRQYNDQFPINRCLSSTSGEVVPFHVANNGGQASSMFPLGRHKNAYPLVKYSSVMELVTSTVDELIEVGEIHEDIDFLLIDAQGAELKILHGARNLLASNVIKHALIEVSVEPLYEHGASFVEVVQFLSGYGLYLREAIFNDFGWANAIFERAYWPMASPESLAVPSGTNLALEAEITQSSTLILEPLRAMSGHPDGLFSFHTMEEDNPWIQLRLPRLTDGHLEN